MSVDSTKLPKRDQYTGMPFADEIDTREREVTAAIKDGDVLKGMREGFEQARCAIFNAWKQIEKPENAPCTFIYPEDKSTCGLPKSSHKRSNPSAIVDDHDFQGETHQAFVVGNCIHGVLRTEPCERCLVIGVKPIPKRTEATEADVSPIK